jgi:trans-aconitate methyltransferase
VSGGSAGHWETIYRTRSPDELSWYQAVPRRSLELIQATGVALTASILDVGGGASPLVDHLLAGGYTDVSVLDIAPAALEQAKTRLGPAATRVQWIAADVTDFHPERRYALWHDRGVFHFLVTLSEQARYLAVLRSALAPAGHLVLAMFGPQGPERCSGLPVQRYSREDLSGLLGSHFRLRRAELDNHLTPRGQHQEFLWSWWQIDISGTPQ